MNRHARRSLTPTAVLQTFGLLLLSQLVFWGGLTAAENAARPAGLEMAPFVSVYEGDKNGRVAADATPQHVPLRAEPGYVLTRGFESQRAIFAHDFSAPLASEQDLSLYIAWTRRIMDVRVNDRLLSAKTASDLWGILGGFEPVIYTIPAHFLETEDNRLTVSVSGRTRHVMPVFYIGDPKTLARAHTFGRIFSIDLVIAATGVLLFVLLLTLSIDWPAEDQVRIRSLSILLAAWALRNMTILDFDSWIPNPWRLFFHFTVTFVFLHALLIFAVGWTRGSRNWYRAAGVTFALAIAASLLAVRRSGAELFRTAFFFETSMSIVIGVIVAALLLLYHARSKEKQTAEILLFLICVTVVVVDAVDDRYAITVPFLPEMPLTFYAAPMCGLLLALGMAASLAAQSTRARLAVMTINETLERRLAEREKEIEASYARQAEYEKHKTLADERQRIVRDMHDGLGGQLVSLLMRARNNTIVRHDLAGELQSTLDDLRLVVHSMNNVGDNLDTALGAFRTKIEPQLKSAGVALDWQMSLDASANGFGPHAVLQIYRILQEACTNAMRHSGASKVSIVAAADGDHIDICVSDDGRGPDLGQRPGGQGVRNMQTRAASLGGDLKIAAAATGSGTVVSLRIPLRRPGKATLSAAS